jgi:hypothetical protein
MNKAKLCGFAIISMLGFAGLSPIAANAAETNSESETITEVNKDQNNQKDRKGAFKEKMKKATEKWNTLTSKQKDEVYAIMEDEMAVENKLMEKLVELGVFEKEDAASLKAFMEERYKNIKDSGVFPFSRKGR